MEGKVLITGPPGKSWRLISLEDNKNPINIQRWDAGSPWPVTVKELKKSMPLNIRTMVGIKDKLLEDLTVIAIEQYEGYEESRAVCWGWLLQLMRSTRRNL